MRTTCLLLALLFPVVVIAVVGVVIFAVLALVSV